MGALGWFRAAGVAAVLGILAGCGGSESCEQDRVSLDAFSTTDNPHRIRYLSSDLSIASVRWHNVTTGASGFATLARVNRCTPWPFVICGDWTEVTMDVPLAPGLNNVQTFQHSDGCAWRSDYAITLT